MNEFKLPAIGEGVVEGEIVRWLKQPGDPVAANEGLVEVMTDKATVEIPAPHDCVVAEIRAAEGEIAAVGEVIAMLGDKGAAATAAPSGGNGASGPATPAPIAPEAAPSSRETVMPTAAAGGVVAPIDAATGTILATPAARAHAREHGIDLARVPGRDGRITKADVVDLQPPSRATVVVTTPPAAGSLSPRGDRPTVPPSTGAPATIPTAPSAPAPRLGFGERPPDETIPFRGMRRRIAEGMKAAYTTAVHYTYVEQIDVSALVQVRKQAKQAAADEGVSLSYLPFIVKAVIQGLRKFPIVNAELDEAAGHILVKKRYSIGIATATDNGLMVPVVHDADRLSILDIGREIARISEAARTGRASRDELTGSTFTITSLGSIGGVLATPILNYPEVGVLGVHAIRKTPIVTDDDQIAIGHLMNLSVSLDHRVVDGFEGASFLQEVKRYLEDPTLLLLSGI